VRGDHPRRPAFERSQWLILGRETALFAVASVLGALYPQITLISMSLLKPGFETGSYSIAARIVDIISGLPWILAGSVLPLLAATVADRERLRYIVRRVFEGSAIAGGLVAIAVVIGARFAIDVVATSGPSGRPSIPVLRIMGAGTTATFLVASLGFVLLAERRHRELVIVNTAAFLFAVVLSVTLIPALGAKGGAITATVLPLALAATYSALVVRSGVTLPVGFLARFAVALAAGMGVGAALLLFHPVPAVLAGGAIYLLVLWRTGVIPHEVITTLKGLAPHRP
jgi:O-antigen/teichoic acid export membrane protein